MKIEDEKILQRVLFEVGVFSGEETLNSHIESAVKRMSLQKACMPELDRHIKEISDLVIGRFNTAKGETPDGN